MRNVVPTPWADFTSTVASNNSHKRFTIDKPIPSPVSSRSERDGAAPSRDGRHARHGGQRRQVRRGGIQGLSQRVAPGSECKPGPVSATHNAQRFGSLASLSPQLTVIPPSRVNLTALRTRFWAMRRIFTASPSAANPGGPSLRKKSRRCCARGRMPSHSCCSIGGDVDRFDLPDFPPRLQSREAGHIVKQVMQSRDIAHQDAHEFVPGRVTQAAVGQTHRGIRDHPQIAAQIMRRLAPQIGSLLFEHAHLVERALEIADVTVGLLLL